MSLSEICGDLCSRCRWNGPRPTAACDRCRGWRRRGAA